MEALLVRIDHFHDRKLYVTTLKTWLETLGGCHGRLVTMGDVHLLLVEATPTQNDALLAKFASEPVDTNAKGEPCADRFIDVVGRKAIDARVCKGFLEMNVLNATLLERLMVGDWHCEKQWIDDALSTPRTKALIQWREEAKNARKDRRKRAAQDRDAERAAKRAKAEEEKAKLEAAKQEESEALNEEAAQDETYELSGDERAKITPTESASGTQKQVVKPTTHVQPSKKAQGPPTKHQTSHQHGSKHQKSHHESSKPKHQHHQKSSGPRPAGGKKQNHKKA